MMLFKLPRYAAIFAALIAIAQSVAAQYKCTDASGAVTLQQTKCPADATTKKIQVAPGNVVEGVRTPAAGATTVGPRGLRIGMTEADLRRLMGAPAQANLGNYAGRTRHQFVYFQGNRTIYVYVADGLVDAVQDRDGGDPSAIARPGSRNQARPIDCLSRNEIRSLESLRHNQSKANDSRGLRDLDRQIASAYECLRRSDAGRTFGVY